MHGGHVVVDAGLVCPGSGGPPHATVGVLAGRDGYAMAAAVERWGAAQRRGPWRGTWPASPVSLGEGLMTEVIDRLAAAVNAHDLDALAGLIHQDYRSEQPGHPGPGLAGRAPMAAQLEGMLPRV